MPTLTYGASTAPAEQPRARWQSFKRGLAGRCPACGKGRIFRAYLKVADHCPSCGEELHHQRADDAPPYFTIMIVGHVVGTALLISEERWPETPMWIPIVLGLALRSRPVAVAFARRQRRADRLAMGLAHARFRWHPGPIEIRGRDMSEQPPHQRLSSGRITRKRSTRKTRAARSTRTCGRGLQRR